MPPSMEVDAALPADREALRNTHPDRILSEFGFVEVNALLRPDTVAKSSASAPLGVGKNMTLTKLILRRNELTRIGADFFFEVLERRPNLSRRITIELFQNKEIPKGLAENVAGAVSTKAPTAGGGSAASSAYTTE